MMHVWIVSNAKDETLQYILYYIIYIHFENNGRMLLSDINGQPETV